MSTSGMQRVFLLAVRGSSLNKKATIHTLRHSYSTHLREEGVSLRYVSAYLGHSSLDQTLVYAHLTEVSEEQTQRATSRLAAALTGGASAVDPSDDRAGRGRAAALAVVCRRPRPTHRDWNVDAWSVGGGDTAFGSLARYIQKTALDSARILEITDTHVTITWIDRESAKRRTARLKGHEFLRRFLQHVLPKGFVRCRHFGFLSAAARTRFARVRSLLHAGEIIFVLPPPPTLPCPCCGKAMTFLRCDRARGPPLPPK